mmetsp:Transcript_3153/g.4437  ORF Transcript_3153/g.4437 Transcript_3153/m.4437 type:complete len:269 (-) Transcript_3153:138-944(-)|eukprot:CAMPEP_0184871040 /NCGR_PEP_ID=MMETSP0580-20130426/39657_1 /TAXON_ID=1118495 /ORGANISM="Dactyliosolen fragilissimus" /LENGTH=268 /DNA_ID=CAMNT_0027373483 /DNA_START=163 /DNA_END=969 /DNA_ORIENTATION=-
MKPNTVALSNLLLIGFFCTSSAGISKPQLSVNVKDGSFEGLEGLDPTLTWATSSSCAGCDLQAGVDVAMKPTTDFLSLPRSIWGSMSRNVASWGLSARTDMDFDDAKGAKFNLHASNEDFGTEVDVNASLDGVESIELAKGFDALGGKIDIIPRYDLKSSAGDVKVGYDGGDTSIEVAASASAQKLTLSRQITENHRLAPSISSNGDLALEWEKSLGNGNSITTLVKPNDSVSVKWEDGPSTFAFQSSLDGVSTGGINVSVKRKIDFF